MQEDNNELHCEPVVNQLSTVVDHRLNWLQYPDTVSLVFLSRQAQFDSFLESHIASYLGFTL